MEWSGGRGYLWEGRVGYVGSCKSDRIGGGAWQDGGRQMAFFAPKFSVYPWRSRPDRCFLRRGGGFGSVPWVWVGIETGGLEEEEKGERIGHFSRC